MTRRFYVAPEVMAGGDVAIAGALAHRIATVLRLRPGAELALFDGEGREARVRLDSVSDRRIAGAIVERYEAPAEPRVKLHLYQSIAKGERFEWLLEKGTEIGVARFVPLIAARSVVKTATEGNRIERWRRIAVEAAEQSGRGAVPKVDPPALFAVAIASAPGIVLAPYEAAPASAPDIQAALAADIDALFALGEVSVLVGPEGGFEPGEIQAAADAGALVVTMGSRILRSETAGLVAATLVMHAVGELG